MRSSAWLLLLCSSLALARDPFQPLAEGVCQPQVAAPDGWRLQGIVGSSMHYVAWLVSPQGKSHRLTSLAMLPHSPWQVAELTARSLILRATQSCPPQQITWVIKGGFYEKDDTHLLPVSQRSAEGQ
ncbi:HofP DNA utilization family protein [Candidatus Pantoea formicae]|uniref:HofP DNA utilization family protein n=1 Tax=Candidatus Pantoea formicae TaxID=2608355 RepID=UPI003ED86ADB